MKKLYENIQVFGVLCCFALLPLLLIIIWFPSFFTLKLILTDLLIVIGCISINKLEEKVKEL